MADILEAISRIDSLCASVGVRAPAGADFGSTLARALGDAAAPLQSAPAGDGQASGSVTSGQPTAARGSLTVPATGPVTSPFGSRTSPITGTSEFHEGIDLGAPYGAPIRAAAADYEPLFVRRRGGAARQAAASRRPRALPRG